MRKMNKRNLIWIMLFGVLTLGITSCEEDESDDDMQMLNDGDSELGPAPDFTLTSVNGGSVSLSDFDNTPVVIFFFGNSCPFCIGSAPDLESEINARFGDDIAMIGIDTWDGSRASVESFRTVTGVTFDLLLNGSSVQREYNTTYDRLFVINTEGNLVHRGRSASINEIETVAAVIESLIE